MRWFWLAMLPLAIACGGDKDGTDTGGDDDDTTGDDDDVTGPDGAELYADNCAVCHGANGEGASAVAMTAVVPGMTREAIVDQILLGGGLMGPVLVTEEEAGAIADYSLTTWGP